MANKKQFSIETVFKMIDRASAPIKAISRQTKKFSNVVKRSFRGARIAATKFTRFIGRKTLGALRRIAQFSLAGLAIGVGLAVRSFVSFDKAITSTVAKFGGINLASKEGQETFDRLKKSAREVGAATEFSATQAAEGLDFLAMAGFNAEQAIASLPKVVDLATVANVDFARAVDISSDTLGAFNLMTEDSAQLQKNLTRVNDVMAKTITSANTNMEDLFESIKKGAPTFNKAGQSMETFAALTGILAGSGIKGGEAGTVLRNVMLRLANATPKASKVMKDLGIKIQDDSGNFLDIIDIIGQFEKSTKKMGTAQRSAALGTIFGARAISGVNVLLSAGSNVLREYRASIEASSGAAADMAKIMRQSIANRLKALSSALTELSFKFIEAFSKDGKNAIESLTEAVRNIDMESFVKTVKSDVIPALRGVWTVIKGIAASVKFLVEQLDNFVGGIMKVANVMTFGGLDRAFARVAGAGAEKVEFQPGAMPTTARSSEAAVQKTVSETTRKGELTIKDETRRAELTGNLGGAVKLAPSGGL